jgi:Predicted AAA-ATPase
MRKRFNVTGVCYHEQHYMADTSAKFARIMDMVEQGDYFTINRPRQYGKTTMLFALVDVLKKREDYVVFRTSFEGVGDDAFVKEQSFCALFLDLLLSEAETWGYTELATLLSEAIPDTISLRQLSKKITELAIKADKKLVLLIDEVDKSSNNQLFISFLGMLRDKYLLRQQSPTFHSVVLTGVHDVKSLKLKISPEAERQSPSWGITGGYNSPWNIAADFEVDMNLQPTEIVPMLEEYAKDRAVAMDAAGVAERLFYYTAGYPFLVSKLCKIFDEKLLAVKTDKTWTTHDVDVAARQLLNEDNTNFQELIKNLRNTPDLYELVEKMLIEGQDFSFSPSSDRINIGLVYGIFANQNNRLVIHNRIYSELILNYMSANAEHTSRIAGREYANAYCMPGNRFDLKKALLKFQELLRTEYNKKERDFLERQGRLVFLSFLKPLLNGHGHAFKEPQVSEEKRLDILITYYQHQYVIELKLWRGQTAHEAGLDQLTDYLDRLGLDEGFLLIFDPRVKKDWKREEMVHQGKRIFAVWV